MGKKGGSGRKPKKEPQGARKGRPDAETDDVYLVLTPLDGHSIAGGTAVMMRLYDGKGQLVSVVQQDIGGPLFGSRDYSKSPVPEIVDISHSHNDHCSDLLPYLLEHAKRRPRVLVSTSTYAALPVMAADDLKIHKNNGTIGDAAYKRRRQWLKELFPRYDDASRKRRKGEGPVRGPALDFVKVAEGQPVHFGRNGEHAVTAHMSPEELEHLPETIYNEYSFQDGKVKASTLFDVYHEADNPRTGRTFGNLAGADVLVMEMTRAHDLADVPSRSERKRQLVDELIASVKDGKKYVMMPAFAQKRSFELLDAVEQAVNELDLGKNEYAIHWRAPMASRLAATEDSPYSEYRPEKGRMAGLNFDMDWSYRPDGKVHFEIATSGFCSMHTPSYESLWNALGSEDGCVVLTSNFAPRSSPLRPLVEATALEDGSLEVPLATERRNDGIYTARYGETFTRHAEPGEYVAPQKAVIPAGKVKIISQTGHAPNRTAYLDAARCAAPRPGGIILGMHGSDESAQSFAEGLAAEQGYVIANEIVPEDPGSAASPVPGKTPIDRPLPEFVDYGDKRAFYCANKGMSLVVCSDGSVAEAPEKQIEAAIRKRHGRVYLEMQMAKYGG